MDFILGFVKDLANHFDFAYMLVVNLITYIVIKVIDELNGTNAVPTWGKRSVAVVSGIILGLISTYLGADKVVICYSFFVSLVSWDALFKPLLKLLGNRLDYRKEVSK